jgi:hypothetical protein
MVYDGTPDGDDLLDIVCHIAREHRAQLTILHVKLVPLTKALPKYALGADAEMDSLVARAERLAGKCKVRAASVVRYARALGVGVVAEARVRGIDLLAILAPDMESQTSGRCISADLETILQKIICAVLLCRPVRRRK